jgi:hypothetical protein
MAERSLVSPLVAPADFPLCADRTRHDMVRPLVEQSVAFLAKEVSPARLEGVILTGSLSRGEGSVLMEPGSFRLLGDIEFLVVVRGLGARQARRRFLDLSRAATQHVGAAGCRAIVEYGPVAPEYFTRKIRPSIFAYDLVRHGKPLAGGAHLLAAVKPFGVEAIPSRDALELIMNRMIELLSLETARLDTDPDVYAYHRIKILLDLAGAALASTGRYVSEYAGRVDAFRRLLADDGELTAALADAPAFLEALTRATAGKLRPTRDLLHEITRADRTAPVARWAIDLWMWQMRRRLLLPTAPFAELVECYLHTESPARRAKAWAKLVLHPLRPARSLDVRKIVRWLPITSPRELTYAAALWMFAGHVGMAEDCRARAAALMPVARRRGGALTFAEIADLWRWYIRND